MCRWSWSLCTFICKQTYQSKNRIDLLLWGKPFWRGRKINKEKEKSKSKEIREINKGRGKRGISKGKEIREINKGRGKIGLNKGGGKIRGINTGKREMKRTFNFKLCWMNL